jgi:hypothetical protein
MLDKNSFTNNLPPSTEIRTPLSRAERLGLEALKAAAAEKGVDPTFGTDLDHNKAGNIYDTVQQAADPQRTESYFDAEGFTETLQGFADNRTPFEEALTTLRGSGVTKHADGTFTLRTDGVEQHVDATGAPVKRQDNS